SRRAFCATASHLVDTRQRRCQLSVHGFEPLHMLTDWQLSQSIEPCDGFVDTRPRVVGLPGGPLFPRVVPLNGSIRSLRPGVHGVRLFVHPSTLADEDRIASGRITSAIRVRTALPGRYRPRPAWSPCRSPTHADTSDATTRAPRRSLPYWTRATRPPCDSPATRTRRQRHRSPHMRIPSPPVHPRPPRHGSGAALSTRTANPAEYSLRSTRATNPSPPHAPPRCRSPTGHQPPAAARSRRPGRPFAA